jgi:hypothetical protein
MKICLFLLPDFMKCLKKVYSFLPFSILLY